MAGGEQQVPVAAAWIRDGRLVGNQHWSALEGAATGGWHVARAPAGAQAPAPLDGLVLAQQHARVATETYAHEDGRRAIQVLLAPAGAAEMVAVAHDVSTLALALRERELDLLRERQRVAGEEFHARQVVHDMGNCCHAIELRVSFHHTIRHAESELDGLLDEIEKATSSARQRIEQLQRAHRGEQLLHDAARLPGASSAPFECIARAAELARRDGCRLTVASTLAMLPRVLGASDELTLVLLLLFDNAREAGGAVNVDAAVEARHIDLHISDDGPGFDKEVQKHMWKPFFTTRPSHRGHGLSLALELVRRCNGRLTATSRDDGDGARFTITLLRADD